MAAVWARKGRCKAEESEDESCARCDEGWADVDRPLRSWPDLSKSSVRVIAMVGACASMLMMRAVAKKVLLIVALSFVCFF